jgi:hypothetical protein
MDPDQPAHPRSLIRIHAVRLPTLLQAEKLIANSMDPDQTARMRTQARVSDLERKNMTRLIKKTCVYLKSVKKQKKM